MISPYILDASLGRVIDHQIKVTSIKHKRPHQIEAYDIQTAYRKGIFWEISEAYGTQNF